MKKEELSKEAFLRLHEIEAESEEFNIDDMYRRLFNLGFNKALEIDQVFTTILRFRIIILIK